MNAILRREQYYRKGADDPLTQVRGEFDQQRIIKSLKATEGYVMFCYIVMGIIQMLCLKYDGKIQVAIFRYLQTPSFRSCQE